MELQGLRDRLIEAIDRVFEEAGVDAGSEGTEGDLVLRVSAPEEIDPFEYRWPEETVTYTQASRMSINDGSATYSFRIGWQTRDAWNMRDRGRWIVFHEWTAESGSPYPVAEFTLTDDGRYAAVVVNPPSGRKGLYPSDPVPTWFATAELVRTDELYDSVANGPSLRIVVDESDFAGMVVHAYWMARVRKIISGGPPSGGYTLAD